MVKSRMAIGFLAVAALLSVAPAAHAGPRFFIQVGTPVPVAPLPVYVAPPPPYGYGYTWRPAYYAWNGYGYQLVPGGWVRPPYRRAVWVGPRWVAYPRGHYWARGYWRR